MSEVFNPHDKGYRFLLSSKTVLMELLESFVTGGWVKKVDPQSLTKEDKSYVLADFKDKEADLVYRGKIDGREYIFYILLELQSTVDFQMPYRLLFYMVEIWRDILKNTGKKEAERKGFRLPAIVPVVLYNGAGAWTAARSFRQMLKATELFSERLLDFEYILVDVFRYQEELLLELSNLIGTVFMLDQATNEQELIEKLGKIAHIVEKFNTQTYIMFAIWFKNVVGSALSEETREKVNKMMDQTKPKEVRQMISNVTEVIRKSRMEGIVEGKREGVMEGKMGTAKNMLAKNLPEELIVEVTGLSLEQIEALKKKKAH